MYSTLHIWYIQLWRKLTSPYFTDPTVTGMKTNWLGSISERVEPFTFMFIHLYSFRLSLRPASHSDLNTNPTRPDPEGESGPPKPYKTQRMESPAKKDTDRRLTTPTKPDAIPRSPGSPASPAHRSKRKEGKGKQRGTCDARGEFYLLKGKTCNGS